MSRDCGGDRPRARGFLRVPTVELAFLSVARDGGERGDGIRQSPIRRRFYSNSPRPWAPQLRPFASSLSALCRAADSVEKKLRKDLRNRVTTRCFAAAAHLSPVFKAFPED